MSATYLLEDDDDQTEFRRLNSQFSEPTSSTSSGDASSDSTGLRSRKKDTKSRADETTVTPTTSSSNKIASKDPLFWFGFLPPQTLRKSQQSFISGKLFLLVVASSVDPQIRLSLQKLSDRHCG